jgi:hypothetical protein
VVNIITSLTRDVPALVLGTDEAGDTVKVTAVNGGVAGDSIVFTENATNLTVDGAGTLGTTTAGVDVAGWSLGDSAQAQRFLANTATLTSGFTAVGLKHRQGSVASDATGPVQAANADLRISAVTAIPDTGKIRVTVYYRQFTPPTS